MAIRYSEISVELREVALNNKPVELLHSSPKATVPVLIKPDGSILEESLDIMHWALKRNDPQNWLHSANKPNMESLILVNDSDFKIHLDHYKYADRFPAQPPAHYRQLGESFLAQLEHLLHDQPYLTGRTISIADIALFPFIRQFAYVDINWFNCAPYPKLRNWLNHWLASDLFASVMHKQPPWVDQQKPLIF